MYWYFHPAFLDSRTGAHMCCSTTTPMPRSNGSSSTEEPQLAFVVLDPAFFKPDYQIQVPLDALIEIQKSDSDELSVVTILTIPSHDPGAVTANLRGPLVMNHRTDSSSNWSCPRTYQHVIRSLSTLQFNAPRTTFLFKLRLVKDIPLPGDSQFRETISAEWSYSGIALRRNSPSYSSGLEKMDVDVSGRTDLFSQHFDKLLNGPLKLDDKCRSISEGPEASGRL